MRQPTPLEAQLAWHRAALSGDNPPMHPDHPECGWFRRKLVKGGVYVPCRIWLEQDLDDAGELADDERLRCQVNGERCDPHDQWTWLCGHPISQSEYEHMQNVRRWAAWHSPKDPAANPRRPIDNLTTPVVF